MAEGDNYEFKVMDLSRGESITWGSYFKDNNEPTTSICLEVAGNSVIVRLSVKDGEELFECKYFVKEISEIMEMEWSK